MPHLRSALAAALTVGLLLSTACSESGPDATASATPTSPTADDRPQRSQADSNQDQWRSLAPLAAGPRHIVPPEPDRVDLDDEPDAPHGDPRGAVRLLAIRVLAAGEDVTREGVEELRGRQVVWGAALGHRGRSG